jgi:hypothetical protein
VAQADKFRGHCFAFASSWTKVAEADKLRTSLEVTFSGLQVHGPKWHRLIS